MKRILIAILYVSVVIAGYRPVLAADMYANQVTEVSPFDLLYPNNVIGEPDGVYADFRDKDTYLKLDMGEGEEGRDGVTLFVSLLDIGASVRLTFLTADGVVLNSQAKVFDVGQTEWTAYIDVVESYRYLKIESPETEQWRLDAVQAVAIDTPAVVQPPEEEIVPDVDETPIDNDEIVANELIKLAQQDAVYVVGTDGKRHPFPNEMTFLSWGYSFTDVTTVDEATMASFLIGKSVTIKPESQLVKLQSVPKVYAVAPGGVLRWVVSEEVATNVYGNDWATKVVDVSDAFWPDYTQGDDVDSGDDVEGWEIEAKPF